MGTGHFAQRVDCGLWFLLESRCDGEHRLVSGRAPFALVAEHFGVAILQGALVDSCIAYTFSMVLTSLTMELVSFLKGWAVRGFALGEQYQEQSPWLRAS